MVVEIDHPTIGKIKQLGIPIKFLNNPAKIRSPPPKYGQHTNEILTKMGYKEEEINQLRQDGIIE
jgi:crotonobetainyl-CoA:carnitine CoA-transferase CaiB-like acyl-CoA transferase